MLPDPLQIEEAARLLNAGELVAFPTETVYGLGADAANPAAVARIFAAKGRPRGHPLIVHVSNFDAAREWAGRVPEAAVRLADAFWPGPLTIVLPRSARASDAVTGGQSSVALRAPAHPVARALLAAFGRGIAAPSANRYGRISPTRAADVREELGDRVALVLDGGNCEVGLESTIVACLDGRVTLLRPGSVSRSQIADVVGTVADPDETAPRAPGRQRSHYAPGTPLAIFDDADLQREVERALAAGERIAVLARRESPRSFRSTGLAPDAGRARALRARAVCRATRARCRGRGSHPRRSGARRRILGGGRRPARARRPGRLPRTMRSSTRPDRSERDQRTRTFSVRSALMSVKSLLVERARRELQAKHVQQVVVAAPGVVRLRVEKPAASLEHVDRGPRSDFVARFRRLQRRLGRLDGLFQRLHARDFGIDAEVGVPCLAFCFARRAFEPLAGRDVPVLRLADAGGR